MSAQYATTQDSCTTLHSLSDKWVLWAHLPHDTNWSLNSYIKVSDIETIEDLVSIIQNLKENVVKNCMLFIMRHNINPIWEDPSNKNGGCFSFKINNKNVGSSWKNLSYAVLGKSITKDDKLFESINGITISPKKTFCIVKIWMKNCNHQNPRKLESIPGLSFDGCLFKKHYS